MTEQFSALDKFPTLTEEELLNQTGSWSIKGFAIASLFGTAGIAVYSLYQFGMDQGYNNNKR
jgi:hypothetical protein